ncbi:MAG: hypothetical protein A2270_06830 [Elusimicrobia bacterium RIFOXYA12_FULL_51_18]|nr:MAG: hypothetical protein A2270_06830 [Elusimicrobia bacterium RIFOXYA12_FULL_51_18]OGS28400.1 MAG: hypothetical protein A2218_05135 [Elusimicrobia bacterium RIFOXYA2_FULL_53_38]
MRKSKISVAVFAVIIAAASLVKAGGFDVDFDRGAFRAVDFMEAIKTSEASRADDAASIVPVPATALNTVNTTVYKLVAPGLQELKKEIVNMPGLSKEFLQQINKEKTVVLYNEDNVFLTTLAGDVHYIILESNDKKLMDFLAKEKTEVLQNKLHNKNLVYVCISKIDTIMKWVGHAWVAYEVIKEICSWENDGTTPSPNNGGGGGSGGQPLHPLPLNPPVRK